MTADVVTGRVFRRRSGTELDSSRSERTPMMSAVFWQVLGGCVQASGWPGVVTVMGNWNSKGNRGTSGGAGSRTAGVSNFNSQTAQTNQSFPESHSSSSAPWRDNRSVSVYTLVSFDRHTRSEIASGLFLGAAG